MTVRTRIIRIGNSQGVRIPKPLLDQSGLTGEVELVIEQDRIVIVPARPPRHGWEEAFAAMAEHSDDRLLEPAETPSEWDEEEWRW